MPLRAASRVRATRGVAPSAGVAPPVHKRGFMRAPMILSLLFAVACAGDQPPDPTPPRPMTVRDHLRAAEAEDQVAAGNQQNAESLRGAPMTWFCENDPLASQATSGFEQLTYITKIEDLNIASKEIVVQRRSEGGVQVLKTKLPCMITMLEGTNTIRFGKMDDLFRAARYDLKTWSRDYTGAEEGRVGLKGSPTVVSKVFVPKPRAEKAKMIEAASDTPDAMAAAAIDAIFAAQPKLADDLLARAAAGL